MNLVPKDVTPTPSNRRCFHIVYDADRSLSEYHKDKENWRIWACTQNLKKALHWPVQDKLVEELLTTDVSHTSDAADETLMWIADQFQMTGDIVILIKYTNPKKKSSKKKKRR